MIAGGGTAGHVVPALAIGRALVERGYDASEIHFVGARRGIDSRLVPPAGFPLTVLPGRGIVRKLTLQNVVSLAALSVAFVRAVALLARLRPAVVVSMGGYAAAPAGLAARALRVPLVLSEQNAVPTATHRLLRRFAIASAVPFVGTPLPNPVVTGNPVRPEVLDVDRSEAGKRAARDALGLPAAGVVIASVGGSLGSRTINTAVLGLAAAWRDRDGIAIRHVIGERDWDASQAAIGDLRGARLHYQAVRYEDRMPELLAAADLVVSRSGGTVAELAVVGRASILVPLPIAPYDHQAANAQVLVRAGAAVMLRDHEATPERLATEIDALLAEPGRLDRMGEAARTVGHPDAAERVADLVIEHANQPAKLGQELASEDRRPWRRARRDR